MRDKAIEELTRLVRDPAQRIALARQFHIPAWIEPALVSLAQADMRLLGGPLAARLPGHGREAGFGPQGRRFRQYVRVRVQLL